MVCIKNSLFGFQDKPFFAYFQKMKRCLKTNQDYRMDSLAFLHQCLTRRQIAQTIQIYHQGHPMFYSVLFLEFQHLDTKIPGTIFR